MRKTWIDYQEYIENPYDQITHLCVRDNLFDEKDENIFNLIQITSLDIYCDKISLIIFMELLNFLPNLKSIRITDFPLHNPIDSHESKLKIRDNF